MTHREFIKSKFQVFAETEKSIFFEAYGEKIAEIGPMQFDCNSVEEFYELIELYDENTTPEDLAW